MGNPIEFSMTIDGKAVDASRRIEVLDPATEQVVARAPDAAPRQLDEAVASARRAAPAWAGLPLEERRKLIARVGEVIVSNQETLAELLTREQGKPLAAARQEVMAAAFWCTATAGLDFPADVSTESSINPGAFRSAT